MKRIVFENPTPAKRGRNNGSVQAFINKLSETPDKWAVYTRTAKYFSYYYSLASKMDNLQIAVRRNADNKTNTVYMMVLSEGATTSRVAEKASKKANAKKVAPKKATTKKVTAK
jgi:uncharacterized protein (DUF1501 family)